MSMGPNGWYERRRVCELNANVDMLIPRDSWLGNEEYHTQLLCEANSVVLFSTLVAYKCNPS